MNSTTVRAFACLAALLLILSGLTLASTRAHAATTPITIDGSSAGRTFDGVGAISGGGGNSRLLADYPEEQRSEILDYLFKPGFGANLQILKLEIGGDTNSTDGAEASHMRTSDSVDCNQGYEWWMAEQAKSRNPGIKLAALSWGAPHWINPNDNFFFTDNAITYLMEWLGCAKEHNLTIDYLGAWNERYDDLDDDKKKQANDWYVKLRAALDNSNYAGVKIVGGEDGWSIAEQMNKPENQALKNAIHTVGVHYPCDSNSDFKQCNSKGPAKDLGNALWASENGSQHYQDSGINFARALNRGYIDSRFTAHIHWPVVAAAYPNLHFAYDGLVLANQPWSGRYDVGKIAWSIAHTTQFTQPGWHYIDAAVGGLSGEPRSGSFVTLAAPDKSDYTTVVETMDSTEDQTIEVAVTGGLSTEAVHVWDTSMDSANPADWFVRRDNITPENGRFTASLKPHHLYTFTTVQPDGAKGTATSPQAGHLNLPYEDNFETAATTTSPKYFSDMNGAFQRVPCGGGRDGSCLRQMPTEIPVRWTDEPTYSPYTFMGDAAWANYTVRTDILFEQPGTAEILGRVMRQPDNNNGLDAYKLQVSDTGNWKIIRTDMKWDVATLAEGRTAELSTGKWHTAALTMQGNTLTATIDGATVGSAADSAFPHGLAGLGVGGYQNVQFDNYSVTPGTDAMAVHGPLTSGIGSADKCVSVGASEIRNVDDPGSAAQIWDCSGQPEQEWNRSDNTLTHNGVCLDVADQGTKDRTPVVMGECNGGASQQWEPQDDGTLRAVQASTDPNSAPKCLEVPDGNTGNGTQLTIRTCDGSANQKWNLPSSR